MEIGNFVLADEAVSMIDDGAWIGDIEGADGVELLVCSMESPAARKAMTTALADARMKNKGEPLTQDQQLEATRRVLADVVLKDWRGITQNGQPVSFEREQAKKWILSRNGERLAGLVLLATQKLDVMVAALADKVEKN